MTDSTALMMAILSMDAYNRGDDKGITIPGPNFDAPMTGTATFMESLEDQPTAFYAAAYRLADGNVVISYRGTRFDGIPNTQDVFYGWTLSLGFSSASQAQQALNFYDYIKAKNPLAQIITTGHSLGGALAAFAADINDVSSYVFNNIPFGGAVVDQFLFNSALIGAPLSSSQINQFITNGEVATGFRAAVLDSYEAYFLAAVGAGGPVAAALAQRLDLSTNSQTLDSYAGYGVNPINLHSSSLMVLLQDAQLKNYTDWNSIGNALYNSYFDKSIAGAVGIQQVAPGWFGPDAIALSEIAYSALGDAGGGTLPFGAAAVASLFSDADLLGKDVTAGKLQGLLAGTSSITGGNDIQNALAEIIVQNAGDQASWAGANGGQDYSGATGAFSASTDTVLKIDTDHSGDADQSLWKQTSGAGTNKILGVEDLVTALENEQSIQHTLNAIPTTSLRQSLIDQLNAFADKATVVEAALTPSAVLDDPAATADGKSAILIGGDGKGTIIAGDADVVVFGGKTITVGDGEDIIVLAGGTDKVHLGTGDDSVFGGTGDDTVLYDTPSAGGYDITINKDRTTGGDVFVDKKEKGGTGANDSQDELVNIKHIVLSGSDDTFDAKTSAHLEDISIDGGSDNDKIEVEGGTDVTTVGGLGRDFLFNGSKGGIIWGDVENSDLDVATDQRSFTTTITDANGNTTTKVIPIADNASNADNFWWSPNATIEDPQYSDIIEFFGIPLVGGDDNGGVVLSLPGLTGIGTAIAAAQIFSLPINTVYVDQFLPFITYSFEEETTGDNKGAYDLKIGNVLQDFLDATEEVLGGDPTGLSAALKKYVGVMTVKDFIPKMDDGRPPGSYDGASQFLAHGKLGLVFKKTNPVYAILAALPPDLLTLGLENGGPLVDEALTASAAALRFSNAIHWFDKTDPLVLDLSGNGLVTTSLDDSSVHFDFANDLFAARTGWLSGDEGFLVLDKNGNGIVDNASEMFGLQTGSGFLDLAAYDSNHDGVIDANDAIFAKLQVWVDANGDGVTDPGELHTLSDLGIASISLNSLDLGDSTTADGTALTAASSFTYADGSSGQVYDATFPSDPTDTIYEGQSGQPAWAGASGSSRRRHTRKWRGGHAARDRGKRGELAAAVA